MRVLYFTRDYTPHDHRFLASLVESGQEVYFLRLERQGRQLEDRPLPPEVQQIPWRGGQEPFRWSSLPRLVMELRAILRRVRPDVLHAGPIQTVAFIAALTGFRPLVTMSWGSDILKDTDRSTLYRWITRFTLRRSSVLVGDCRPVREKAVALGIANERIFTFPWGIDLARFSPAGASTGEDLRARLGWQDNFVILSLRSWEPIYGVDVMLRGFAQAAQEAPDLRLFLLGGGSQAAMVHRIIQEHGLGNMVYLGGQVKQEDLPGMYRAADLYVSASHSDGSSVSLMEALGSALPVLVSDIPGNREWVTPEQEGWLFRDGDSAGLSARILHACSMAYNQPGQWAALRNAARIRAEQQADWQKNFQVLMQAYQAAVR